MKEEKDVEEGEKISHMVKALVDPFWAAAQKARNVAI